MLGLCVKNVVLHDNIKKNPGNGDVFSVCGFCHPALQSKCVCGHTCVDGL